MGYKYYTFFAIDPKLRALYLESIVLFRLYSVFTGRTTRVSERDSKCSPPEYKYGTLALHQIAALDSADYYRLSYFTVLEIITSAKFRLLYNHALISDLT